MGCVPSAPQHAAPPKRAPSQQPPRPTAAAYETELAASLTDGGAQSVAYHGLLNRSNAISLQRSPESAPHKLAQRSMQPSDSCAPDALHDARLSVVHGVAMTMPYTVIVAKPHAHAHVSQLVTAVFAQYDAVLNAWNAGSEISAINALAPTKSMPLSPQLEQLFCVVDHVFDITDARFDPTTAVLNVAFENCIRHNNRPPLPNELQPYKHAVGWHRRVKRANNCVSRTNAHTLIHLDGISKGFVIDRIVQRLLEAEYQHVYVDWSADIRAVGNHPSGRPWRAALIQPPQLKRLFAHWREQTLPEMLTADDISHLASFQFEALNDVSLATSGDYFCVQKYGYHHIARSADLSVMKANLKSVASVCIAASTCAVADAIATAAMTFDSVADAVQFCAALCDKLPRELYGYCVMARDCDAVYSSSIFEPVAARADKPSEQHAVKRVSAPDLRRLRHSIFAGRAVVVRGDRSENIHSLVSLSLSPEQLVSFHASSSFASDEDRRCECVILYDDSPFTGGSKGVSLQLFIKHVYDVSDDGAVLVASVESVRVGDVQSVKVVHDGAVLTESNFQLSCARSKFPLLALVDQCKHVFRNYASMMWIVTTTSVEHQLFALTATSVSVSQVLKDVLCFNVVHTSAFYAAFGGVGSEVCLYALSSALRDLATKYTGQSGVDDLDAKRLQSGSVAAVHGSVAVVNDVQDHHVVVVRVHHIVFNDDAGTPLIWLQGGFV